MSIATQLLLASVALLSCFLITVLGIQVFHILVEFRQVIKKLNNILANTQTLSENSARPITAVNQFFAEVKTLVKDTQDEIIESTPDRPHVFRRAGVPLRPN